MPRPTRPVKELVPLNVLLPLKVFEFARSVEEAAVMVMSAEPLKETLLMRRAVWRMVAVAALPPMLRVEVEVWRSAVPAELV